MGPINPNCSSSHRRPSDRRLRERKMGMMFSQGAVHLSMKTGHNALPLSWVPSGNDFVGLTAICQLSSETADDTARCRGNRHQL
jgi:hypothetical protein